MQLTRYTDYGFRLMTYLALLPEGRRANIGEISEIYDISRNNINKVVHQLGRAGLIDTKQGKGGGFCLKRAADDINIRDLLVLLENNIAVVDCHSPPCRIVSACVLKDIFQQATQAFLDTLQQYTLADLVKSEQTSLIQLLEINEK